MNFIAPGITLIGTGFVLVILQPMLAEKAVLILIGCGLAACGWMLVWVGSMSHRSKL